MSGVFKNKNARAVLLSLAISVSVIAISGIFLWYYFVVWAVDLWDRRSDAVGYAVNIAFGIDPTFPEHAVFASAITPDLMEQCYQYQQIVLEQPNKNDAPSSWMNIPLQYCYGWSDAHFEAYYDECHYYFEENCVPGGISKDLFQHPDLFAKLQQVLKSPCKYLPTNEEIAATLAGNKDIGYIDPLNTKYQKNLVRNSGTHQGYYRAARRTLQCDGTDTLDKFKYTVSVFENPSGEIVDKFIIIREGK